MALRAIWKFMEWAVDIIYRNSGYRVVRPWSLNSLLRTATATERPGDASLK